MLPHELVQQLSTTREPARALIRRVRGQKGFMLSAGGDEMKARIALEVLKRVATALATDATERRAVVVVSEGHPGFGEGPVDTAEGALVRATCGEVLQAAAFANVAVYGVDPRGLEAPLPTIGTWNNGGLAAAAALQGAKVAAGVLTMDTNDLGTHIPRILQDSRQYYRLAYAQPEPEDGKAQPRSRHIEVKVARSGVDVRARQRYMPR